MTISEHLGFSVLTVPVAALDRRTLSQAWYSALYGDRQTPAPAKAQTASPVLRRAPSRREVPAQCTGRLREPAAPAVAHDAVRAPLARGGEVERRSPRSTLARRIERTFLHSKHAPRKASFALDGEHGRVQIILRSQGSRLKLVAICAPKAKAQVAHALAQARYALALRGIDLESQAREQSS